MRRHPVNGFAQDFIATPPVQQEMRRIGDNLPAFFSCKIVEQPANARQSHKLVAPSRHGEHGRRDGGCFVDGRLCEFRHPAQHFRFDTAHHQRVADQTNGRGRCQLPARQAFENDFGVAGHEADSSAHKRDQSLANPRSERARRHENKPSEMRKSFRRSGVNRNGATEAFADDEQRRFRPGAIEQNATGVDRVLSHERRSGPCAAGSRRTKSALIDGESGESAPRKPRPYLVERCPVIERAVQQKHCG